MDKKLDLIVGKDENNQDIIINIYVNEKRDITGINFAGITYNEVELQKFNITKLNEELYLQIDEQIPLDISVQNKYANMGTEEIIKLFEIKS